MIPAPRTSDDPQPADLAVTVTVEFRIQAQRAELHLDLPDELLAEMAVNAVHAVGRDVQR
jgi:hypothetical protein